MTVFDNALYRVVGKSVACGEGLNSRLAVLSACNTIHAIAVAAHPYLAVARLTERYNLVENAQTGLVEFIYMVMSLEETLTFGARLEFDGHHATYATHHELTVFSDQTANTTFNVTAVGEGVFKSSGMEIVEEESLVGSYPHAMIEAVVG